MSTHILMVDDDALLRRSLSFNLERAGYRVSTAASAEDALSLARHNRPDLVLLDIGLPGMDGLEALRHFQSELAAPVIFLSARRRELDQVLGLEMGGDDYVTKPFDLDVLLARIKAVLRRSQPAAATAAEPTSLVVGDLAIDSAAHTVRVGERAVDLAPREFDFFASWRWMPSTWSQRMTSWPGPGVRSIRASPRWSTSMFAGCVRNWRTTPPTRAVSSRCAASGTSSNARGNEIPCSPRCVAA